MESFTPKKVDESWKASVDKEKVAPPEAKVAAVPETDFLSFASTLAMQTLAALGELSLQPDGQTKIDLGHAQYLIDILQMLSEKTQGNITQQETDALKALLYELRLKFIAKKQQGPPL